MQTQRGQDGPVRPVSSWWWRSAVLIVVLGVVTTLASGRVAAACDAYEIPSYDSFYTYATKGVHIKGSQACTITSGMVANKRTSLLIEGTWEEIAAVLQGYVDDTSDAFKLFSQTDGGNFVIVVQPKETSLDTNELASKVGTYVAQLSARAQEKGGQIFASNGHLWVGIHTDSLTTQTLLWYPETAPGSNYSIPYDGFAITYYGDDPQTMLALTDEQIPTLTVTYAPGHTDKVISIVKTTPDPNDFPDIQVTLNTSDDYTLGEAITDLRDAKTSWGYLYYPLNVKAQDESFAFEFTRYVDKPQVNYVNTVTLAAGTSLAQALVMQATIQGDDFQDVTLVIADNDDVQALKGDTVTVAESLDVAAIAALVAPTSGTYLVAQTDATYVARDSQIVSAVLDRDTHTIVAALNEFEALGETAPVRLADDVSDPSTYDYAIAKTDTGTVVTLGETSKDLDDVLADLAGLESDDNFLLDAPTYDLTVVAGKITELALGTDDGIDLAKTKQMLVQIANSGLASDDGVTLTIDDINDLIETVSVGEPTLTVQTKAGASLPQLLALMTEINPAPADPNIELVPADQNSTVAKITIGDDGQPVVTLKDGQTLSATAAGDDVTVAPTAPTTLAQALDAYAAVQAATPGAVTLSDTGALSPVKTITTVGDQLRVTLDDVDDFEPVFAALVGVDETVVVTGTAAGKIDYALTLTDGQVTAADVSASMASVTAPEELNAAIDFWIALHDASDIDVAATSMTISDADQVAKVMTQTDLDTGESVTVIHVADSPTALSQALAIFEALTPENRARVKVVVDDNDQINDISLDASTGQPVVTLASEPAQAVALAKTALDTDFVAKFPLGELTVADGTIKQVKINSPLSVAGEVALHQSIKATCGEEMPVDVYDATGAHLCTADHASDGYVITVKPENITVQDHLTNLGDPAAITDEPIVVTDGTLTATLTAGKVTEASSTAVETLAGAVSLLASIPSEAASETLAVPVTTSNGMVARIVGAAPDTRVEAAADTPLATTQAALSPGDNFTVTGTLEGKEYELTVVDGQIVAIDFGDGLTLTEALAQIATLAVDGGRATVTGEGYTLAIDGNQVLNVTDATPALGLDEAIATFQQVNATNTDTLASLQASAADSNIDTIVTRTPDEVSGADKLVTAKADADLAALIAQYTTSAYKDEVLLVAASGEPVWESIADGAVTRGDGSSQETTVVTLTDAQTPDDIVAAAQAALAAGVTDFAMSNDDTQVVVADGQFLEATLAGSDATIADAAALQAQLAAANGVPAAADNAPVVYLKNGTPPETIAVIRGSAVTVTDAEMTPATVLDQLGTTDADLTITNPEAGYTISVVDGVPQQVTLPAGTSVADAVAIEAELHEHGYDVPVVIPATQGEIIVRRGSDGQVEIVFPEGMTLDGIRAALAGVAGPVRILAGGETLTWRDGQLRWPEPAPASNPITPPSNENVPNHAQPQGCSAWKPVGEADLFQIDRRGSTATLYFTPVTDYTDRYHVVFGHAAGDERYGGISLVVDAARNRGVLAIDIRDLDPSATYSFKVAPVNDCAVGTWSNWLTAKPVSRTGATTVMTYRYPGQ